MSKEINYLHPVEKVARRVGTMIIRISRVYEIQLLKAKFTVA